MEKKMEYKIELTIRDTNGAILSVMQSTHRRINDARRTAGAQARAWATRYGYDSPVEHHGMVWTVHNASGVTMAQVAIRN